MRFTILVWLGVTAIGSISVGQVLPFRSEFDANGDPVLWRSAEDGTPGMSIEDGNLVLQNDGGYLGVFPDETSSSDTPITNSIIRTQFRVISTGSGDSGFYSLASRANPGNIYWGGIRGNGSVVVGVVDENQIIIRGEKRSGFDVLAHDLTMELQTRDNRVDFSIWHPEDPEGAVSMGFTYDADRDLQPGNIGVYINGSFGGDRKAEFRWFEAFSLAGLGGCDGNLDGDCDRVDLEAMYDAIGTDGIFDVDGDGVVGPEDIDGWLAAASITNQRTLVLGDLDLSGSVDSEDLGRLLNNFQSTAATAGEGVGWGNGDLNADGDVGSDDLGLLLNNFGHVSANAVAVPEPDACWTMWLAILCGYCVRRLRVAF